jgi:hypothetical protein
MEIKSLFRKDITRDVQGVITIGNETEEKKREDLDEYVCTAEIISNFRAFFSAYRKSIQTPTDKMGAWITGFYGSGKSHFLKILGYVLSNETIGGKKPIDYLEDKIADNMIKADMKTSAEQKNLVVMFDIDSKAKADAKNRNLSIMETMLNCFNESIGLCGSIPWLADLEWGLVKDGLYDSFVKHFGDVSGKDYLSRRKDIFFLRDNFIKTLSDVRHISLDSSRGFFDDAQKNFSTNIDSFAQRVTEYCDMYKSRVIFLIDEMGQYISTNSNLMLNLQTVVEDLGKYAAGRAWVVVTSQQEINALVEGVNKAAKLDFSKIQGRFATRLMMSSSNADEVIKRRLLEKNDDAKNYLGAIYDKNADKLNNLLMFPSNPKWTGYKDKDQFIDDYPFVNYQYELLQQAFDAIRDNGMSEGKSISSGERSLLSAFQESAKAKASQEVGLLIPFSDFYATAEEFMDWNIKQVFSSAEKRMSDPFDVSILQVLFMLKNVKMMEPTIERIATLMVTSMSEDKAALKVKIKESLDRLIAETFVAQNGDRYEFLTDEEQDVTRKIRNSQYSTSDVYTKIRDIIYDSIVQYGKNFPYKGKYSFALNRYVDENLSGSDNSDGITVKIFTPWDQGDTSFEQRSMSSDGCLVIDLTNGSYLEELIQLSKITTFDRNNAATAGPSLQTILQKKRAEATEREKRAMKNLDDCLSGADFYQNGVKLEIATHDAKKRFEEGVEKAILNKYSKLNYVVEFANKIDDISIVLRSPQLSGTVNLLDADPNGKAMADMLSYIKDEKRWSRPVSMNGMVSHFSKMPYGYRGYDIRVMIAKLLVNGYIKARMHGEIQKFNAQNFIWEFSKGTSDAYISLELQEKIDEGLLLQVKKIMKDEFDRTIELKEKELADQSFNFFKTKLEDLKKISYSHGAEGYPGKDLIGKTINAFQDVTASEDPESIFKKIISYRDFFHHCSNYLDSILSFYQENGSQMKIWRNAKGLVDYFDANRMLIPEVEKMSEIVEKMSTVLMEEYPFGDIPSLGNLVAEANSIKGGIVEARRDVAQRAIEEAFAKIAHEREEILKKSFSKTETSGKINDLYQSEENLHSKLLDSLSDESNIDKASSRANQEVQLFRENLLRIVALDVPAETPNKPIKEKKKTRVSSSELIPVANKTITSAQEVDDLVAGISDELKRLLKDNDEIDID